jgi:hypothetical protein
MYPANSGSTFMVQQFLTGTGRFDKSEFGRASLDIPGPGMDTELVFLAKKYGVLSNSYTVELIDPGGTTAPLALSLVGNAVRIQLQRVAGAIVTTAPDAANLINSSTIPGFPLWCDPAYPAGVDPLGAAGPLPLTGGEDPTEIQSPYQYKWQRDNLNGGMFYFEQAEPVFLRKFGATMDGIVGPTEISLWAVNMTKGGRVLTFEKVRIFTFILDVDKPDIAFTDVREPLLPNQCYLVECNLAGLVQLFVRRESYFPYV